MIVQEASVWIRKHHHNLFYRRVSNEMHDIEHNSRTAMLNSEKVRGRERARVTTLIYHIHLFFSYWLCLRASLSVCVCVLVFVEIAQEHGLSSLWNCKTITNFLHKIYNTQHKHIQNLCCFLIIILSSIFAFVLSFVLLFSYFVHFAAMILAIVYNWENQNSQNWSRENIDGSKVVSVKRIKYEYGVSNRDKMRKCEMALLQN